MIRVCRDCESEFDDSLPFHRQNGYIDQCGHCAEDESGDRMVAVEEGDGTKSSCEVTPVHPDALGSARSGVGRYVKYQQRFQPIGQKKN